MTFFKNLNYPQFYFPQEFKNNTYFYFAYLYGGAITVAAIYGAKKGTDKWLHWKKTRTYKKISIDYVESVVNIACDGGTWAYYTLMCSIANAFVAATSPVSVPLLLTFFEDKPKNIKNVQNIEKK